MLKLVSSPVQTPTLAAWWGFAEADRVILGVVVAVLAVMAVAHVLVRARQARSRRTAALRHVR